MKRYVVTILGVWALLSVFIQPAEARVRWATRGDYRLRLESVGPFALDETNTESQRRYWARHRLRLDPKIEVGRATIHMQIDVLTGQIFGDTEPIGAPLVERRHGDPLDRFDGWTTVEPRMLWVLFETEWFDIQFGQMGSRWGIGLLAGDGHVEPLNSHWVERLGDRWNGDLVDRLMVTTQPFRTLTHGPAGDLELSIGAEYVYQDDRASFLEGDSAGQLLMTILYPGESVRWGLYLGHREQVDRDGDTLSLTSIDAFGEWLIPLYLVSADLRVQSEALLHLGQTDQVRAEGADILQLGWVARGEINWQCPRVALGLEVGYASGDADPDDGQLHELSFDPDFRVGLILFSDVLRLITLRGAERWADPELVGVAPAGADQIPTDGAVRNTVYIHPAVTWRPGPWQLTGSTLIAWASSPFLDRYNTFQAGGAPRSHLRRPSGRFYGTEFAASAQYSLLLPQGFKLRVGLQGGLFLPGTALSPAGWDAPVGKVVWRIGLRW